MTDDPKRPPRFWPLMFVTAFLLGAILWVFWMTKFVVETRARRIAPTNDFFVPMATNSPAATNSPPH